MRRLAGEHGVAFDHLVAVRALVLVAGPLSALASAGIGVGTLWLTGALPPHSQVASAMGLWWGGLPGRAGRSARLALVGDAHRWVCRTPSGGRAGSFCGRRPARCGAGPRTAVPRVLPATNRIPLSAVPARDRGGPADRAPGRVIGHARSGSDRGRPRGARRRPLRDADGAEYRRRAGVVHRLAGGHRADPRRRRRPRQARGDGVARRPRKPPGGHRKLTARDLRARSGWQRALVESCVGNAVWLARQRGPGWPAPDAAAGGRRRGSRRARARAAW